MEWRGLIFSAKITYMGSGKGQARRARAVQTSAQLAKAVWHEERWGEFVKSSGIAKTKAFSYYLGKGHTRWQTESDAAQVTEELFGDAVGVGAIVLPSGYEVEDFKFEVGPDINTGVTISLREQPNLDRRGTDLSQHYLGHDCTMEDPNISWALEKIIDAVNGLLNAAATGRYRS